MSHLKQILDKHPEIRQAFDLAVEKHPAEKYGKDSSPIRSWFGYLLKAVIPNKPKLGEIDIKTMKWTLTRLGKRTFESEDKLFAAGKAIYLEIYEEHWRDSCKKGKGKQNIPTIGELLRRG